MDVTCRLCGNPADAATTEGTEGLCAVCVKRAQRRRSIFDVSTTAAPEKPAPAPPTPEEPPSLQREDLSELQEEMRLIDLRALARRTQESLAARPSEDDSDAPLSVHEAVLLVDSLATATVPASSNREESPRPKVEEPTPSLPDPPQKRWHVAGSGAALLLVMGAFVAAKARLRSDTTSEDFTPEQANPPSTSPDLATSASTSHELSGKGGSSGASASAPSPQAISTPAAAPKRASVAHPSPPPSRPRAAILTVPAESRAAAESTATPHVDLMDAMQAAVARHPAPPGAPKADCPPSSTCPRSAPKTSSLP